MAKNSVSLIKSKTFITQAVLQSSAEFLDSVCRELFEVNEAYQAFSMSCGVQTLRVKKTHLSKLSVLELKNNNNNRKHYACCTCRHILDN